VTAEKVNATFNLTVKRYRPQELFRTLENLSVSSFPVAYDWLKNFCGRFNHLFAGIKKAALNRIKTALFSPG
jgi:hypothetical protein